MTRTGQDTGLRRALSRRSTRFRSRVVNRYRRSGRGYFCYVCKKESRGFLPYRGGVRAYSPFVQQLALTGSDVDHFSCAHCGSFDRERHILMYFDRLDVWQHVRGGNVLHFAPESHVVARIRSMTPASYVLADLMPSRKIVEQIDVRSIPASNDSYDLVICNHVLEHVVEDDLALLELYRVTKRNGMCVLQTPYSPVLAESFSDPAINSDLLRERFYGQSDHVRVYGTDLFQRIAGAGFRLVRHSHADTLSDLDPARFGVNADEDLICAVKG